MSQFDPASLSPVRVKARECALPYGLTWVDLAPCLPGLDAAELYECQALMLYEKQGLDKGTNSCIITLRYRAAGTLRERTVFAKQTADANAREEANYRFLSGQGVPTPELLVAVSRNRMEVLALEFLPTIGVDFHVPSQVRDLLHLVARLNSVTGEAAKRAPGRGMPRADHDALVKAALTKVSLEPPGAVDAERLFRGYAIARDALASMPHALSHGELYFQQVGWSDRDGARRLVLFDLATLDRRPRFTDIAGILPLLARESGERELELFEIYLESLRRFTGLRPSIHQPLASCDLRELPACARRCPGL